MSRLHIETVDGRTSFDPGEEIDLTLSWDLAAPAESIELRLVWNTSGKGTTDLDVVRKVPFEHPSASETRRTSVTMPQSPYSFSGQLVSLIWAIELIAFPSEESTRKEITIAPGGDEVRLRAVTDDEFMS